MNNQLVIGIILIVVGIALALLAYAFILNRREQEAKPEDGAEAEAKAIGAAEVRPADLEPGLPPPWAKPPAPPLDVAAQPLAPPAAAVSQPPSPPPAAAAPSVPIVPPIAAPPPAGTLAPSRRTLAVATLMRDEVTGKLLVLVGDREYATADELRASKDYSRVEFAAADLVQWLGAAAVRERVADRADKEAAKRPVSMVEQINELLQQKLVEAFGGTRGIRLVEGPGGTLRVYFGLQSYSLDEIPDADVKRMMREAVAEWEAKQ
jgi:hypothetical protein